MLKLGSSLFFCRFSPIRHGRVQTIAPICRLGRCQLGLPTEELSTTYKAAAKVSFARERCDTIAWAQQQLCWRETGVSEFKCECESVCARQCT